MIYAIYLLDGEFYNLYHPIDECHISYDSNEDLNVEMFNITFYWYRYLKESLFFFFYLEAVYFFDLMI